MNWRKGVLFAGVLGMVAVPAVFANGLQAQFHLGRFWTNPENEPAESSLMCYPGGVPRNEWSDGSGQQLKRSWLTHTRKHGGSMLTIDWTNELGTLYADAYSYMYRGNDTSSPPRYRLDKPDAFNYLYAVSIQEYMRFPRPKLILVVKSPTSATGDTLIDFIFFPGSAGLDQFKYPASGGKGPRPDVIVDPNLVTELKINTVWRYIMGVESIRDVYGYGQTSPHQDYVFTDYKLVNNGISGRTANDHPPSDGATIQNQVINKMLWWHTRHLKDEMASVANQQCGDQEMMYVEPFGAGNHSIMMAWDVDLDDPTSPGPDWGDPIETAFFEGHLAGNAYIVNGPVFASAGPGANYGVDDPAQPAFRTVWQEYGFDFGKTYSPADPAQAREMIADGSLQMDLNVGFRDDPRFVNYVGGANIASAIWGYGKLAGPLNLANVRSQGYDMPWLDSLRFVEVMGAGGIDVEEARRIGNAWNTNKLANPGDPASWMSAADIALIQTGRDTALKACALSYWNFHGHMPANVTAADLAKWGLTGFVTSKPAQYGPFDAPDAPRPPGFLSVRPLNRVGIEVRWGKEAETTPDHDTKVMDFAGYRIYRQTGTRMSPMVLIKQGPASDFAEVAADGAFPAGRVFHDVNVTPGVDYWYAVVAYDDGTQNWELPGYSMESTRWWTWSGYMNKGATAPEYVGVDASAAPGKFMLAQNTPNPFNPTTTIKFSLAGSAQTKLVVYSLTGQVVRTLINGQTAAGVHSVVWDGNDNMGRPVASGVYLYRLTSGTNEMVRRMVLVR